MFASLAFYAQSTRRENVIPVPAAVRMAFGADGFDEGDAQGTTCTSATQWWSHPQTLWLAALSFPVVDGIQIDFSGIIQHA